MKTNNIKRSVFRIVLITILCISILLAAAAVAAWWFVVASNVRTEITIEAGTESFREEDFLKKDYGLKIAIVEGKETINLRKPGDYPVKFTYCGRAFGAMLKVRDTVSPEAEVRALEALSVSMPAPEDFIVTVRDATHVTVEFLREPDGNRAGEQRVSLLLTDEGGNTVVVQTTLNVTVDSEAPVIEGVTDLVAYLGHEIDYLSHVTVSDDVDEAPVLTVDDSKVELADGKYEIIYRCVDTSGNESTATAVLTVVEDHTAPVILGVNPISLYAGSTVSYRSGILVTDDKDERPLLKIDSSGVDLSKPGSYEVRYIATDAAGNETVMTAAVTVAEKKDTFVEEDKINEAADKILKGIIEDGMTDREKVEAIYRWEKKYLRYTGFSDKTDWMQAAYEMLVKKKGDCFNYYAVSKLLFDRLNIPNITVLRSADSVRGTKHYWSLVSVDGGQSWYHFDGTPHAAGEAGRKNFCLVTDAYLDDYDRLHPGYYTRDRSLYPATPEE